ncbi:MAG: response regulator [Flavisolibacter sp.]|jgi:CheY-like chemotaxis protein
MKKRPPYINQVVLSDDDKDHGILFGRVLTQVDPTKSLIVIKNGDELISFLNDHTPDLLFLDLNMPCKNGIECLEEIRKNPRLNKLLIVVYSSSSQMTDIQRSYLHNADLYMVKPFSTEHLKTALKSILKMEWRDNYEKQRFYFINNRFVPFTA